MILSPEFLDQLFQVLVTASELKNFHIIVESLQPAPCSMTLTHLALPCVQIRAHDHPHQDRNIRTAI
jgi:hypothetical protein